MIPDRQCNESVVLVEADEKLVVKCIVISPKGKQKSLISAQHPYSIVNNRFSIPERPKRITQGSAVNYTFKKGLTHFSLPNVENGLFDSVFIIPIEIDYNSY